MGEAQRNPSSFCKPIRIIQPSSRPITRIKSKPYITVKRRVRPIGNLFDVTMFYRIVMDVVHISFPIGFIAQSMLPENSLPNPALALIQSTYGSSCGVRQAKPSFPRPLSKPAIGDEPNFLVCFERYDDSAYCFCSLPVYG